jgi:hypothetical protein
MWVVSIDGGTSLLVKKEYMGIFTDITTYIVLILSGLFVYWMIALESKKDIP